MNKLTHTTKAIFYFEAELRGNKKSWIRQLFIAFAFMLYLTPTSATDYYVSSSSGDDSNDGTLTTTPWKTLAKVNGFSPSPGDKILFKRGDTWYGTLDPKGSGTSGIPINYGAYGSGEKPIITGFQIFTGWVNEGNGVYSTVIIAPKLTNMVLLDGIQQTMGRYPNTGHLTYESFNTNESITDNQLSGNPDWTGAEMVLTKNGWEIDRTLITDHTGNTITYTDYVWNSIPSLAHSGGSYFIQNDRRTLDSLGEWYHDVNTGKFYMYFGGVNPDTRTVKVTTIENTMVDKGGSDYLVIEDLHFIGSISQNVLLSWQNDYLTIRNCDVDFSGTTGIQTSGAFTNISGCTIDNTNGVGILSSGSGPSITYNTITNQGLIEGQGSLPYIYRGAIHLYGTTNPNIANNIINNTGYDGIAIGTNSISGVVIKNNYITNTCILRQDQGAIYTSGAQKPLIDVLIAGNIIVNSAGEGIYLDAYSTNVLVLNNSVSGSGRGGIFLHMANNNSITGNTIYDNNYGLKMSNWYKGHDLLSNTITNNIIVAKSTDQFAMSYITRDPNYLAALSSSNFDNNYYARPIDDDYSIRTDILINGVIDKTLSEWRTFANQDLNSHKSPISLSNSNDILFDYNVGTSLKVITLSKPMIDITGRKYKGTYTIPAYRSIILMPDPNPDLTYVTSFFYTYLKVDIYPNPASNDVTVRFSSIPEKGTKIEFTDINGKLLIRKEVESVSEVFDIQSLLSGIYLVKIISGNNYKVNKLIVNY